MRTVLPQPSIKERFKQEWLGQEAGNLLVGERLAFCLSLIGPIRSFLEDANTNSVGQYITPFVTDLVMPTIVATILAASLPVHPPESDYTEAARSAKKRKVATAFTIIAAGVVIAGMDLAANLDSANHNTWKKASDISKASLFAFYVVVNWLMTAIFKPTAKKGLAQQEVGQAAVVEYGTASHGEKKAINSMVLSPSAEFTAPATGILAIGMTAFTIMHAINGELLSSATINQPGLVAGLSGGLCALAFLGGALLNRFDMSGKFKNLLRLYDANNYDANTAFYKRAFFCFAAAQLVTFGVSLAGVWSTDVRSYTADIITGINTQAGLLFALGYWSSLGIEPGCCGRKARSDTNQAVDVENPLNQEGDYQAPSLTEAEARKDEVAVETRNPAAGVGLSPNPQQADEANGFGTPGREDAKEVEENADTLSTEASTAADRLHAPGPRLESARFMHRDSRSSRDSAHSETNSVDRSPMPGPSGH